MSVTGVLARIIESKRKRLAQERARVPPEQLLEQLREQSLNVRRGGNTVVAHAFRAALTRDASCHIIAEFKRSSPSKGDLRTDALPAEAARAYEAGGAAAISVLTEEDHFRGSLADLQAIRATVALPVLRKDFIIDEYQVYETALAGADALLLIVAALDDETLRRLRQLAEEVLEIDALVEVHTADEMRRAVACGAKVIGVNNRDLHTFDVSLSVSIELSSHAPVGTLLISESGLRSGADLKLLRLHGYKGFLIGETLMRADKPEEALRVLIREVESGGT